MIDLDTLAENHYSRFDPQCEVSADDLQETNEHASRYVAKACIDAINELSQEELESIANDSDRLWEIIGEYLWTQMH